MNLLKQSIERQGYSNWYHCQSFLVVGAGASLPAALISGAQAIANLFHVATNFSNKSQDSNKSLWAARDLLIIFADNLLNACTLGALNAVLLRAGLLNLEDSAKKIEKMDAKPSIPKDDPLKKDLANGAHHHPSNAVPQPLPPPPAPPPALLPMNGNPGVSKAHHNPSSAVPHLLPNTPPPSAPQQNMDLEKVVFTDSDSMQVEGCLKLSSGKHSIQLQHDGLQGYSKGAILEINITGPIYSFTDARFGRMQQRGPCLIMRNIDFQTIKNVIHAGAFGNDISDLGDGLVVVWKIPADLLYIGAYQPDLTPVNVGTYYLYDDLQKFHDPFSSSWVNMVQATKMRIDTKIAPYQTESVHYFTVQLNGSSQKYFLSGISTGNFYKNFNSPAKEEEESVLNMLEELSKCGIGAFLCNSQHHAVIFYTYTQNQQSIPQIIRPEDFAKLLLTDPRIFTAIQKAANKDMRSWAQAYIAIFGQRN